MTLNEIAATAVNTDLTPFLTVLKWILIGIGGLAIYFTFEADRPEPRHRDDHLKEDL